ncbi:MAG: hypothetical protein ACOCX2_14845, partial [Armatimonadota bacterium]
MASRRHAGAVTVACLILAGTFLTAGACRAERPSPMVFMAGLQGSDAAETVEAINDRTPVIN